MKKIAITLLIMLTLFSCVTKIDDLRNNPKKYAGQTVSIRGTITSVINIPLTDFSFFKIKDKTSDIIVFTVKEHLKGDKITIQAKVIAYDSTKSEESTLNVINSIKEFLKQNTQLDEDKIKSSSTSVGNFLSIILKKMEATYMLIEQDK